MQLGPHSNLIKSHRMKGSRLESKKPYTVNRFKFSRKFFCGRSLFQLLSFLASDRDPFRSVGL